MLEADHETLTLTSWKKKRRVAIRRADHDSIVAERNYLKDVLVKMGIVLNIYVTLKSIWDLLYKIRFHLVQFELKTISKYFFSYNAYGDSSICDIVPRYLAAD